ncbi:hypothetical protein P8452_75021 [Trifolium repens]|nr:hypothetical protein P8452_75021 [Trifolium repens]
MTDSKVQMQNVEWPVYCCPLCSEVVEDEMHVFFDCDRPDRAARLWGCCNDTRQQHMWFFISAVLQK